MIYKVLIILAALINTAAYSETAEEIVTKAENSIKGESSHGTFTMKVVRPEFTRTVTMEAWNDGNENALIIIKAPKKEQGNKTLKRGNEMWQYLENTETTMKLPQSMLLQSWNGSDLTNDDLLRETNLANDYILDKLGEEKIEGANCWKIRLRPKKGVAVAWGEIIYLVRKKDYLPAKIEFYDEKGRLHRTMFFSGFKKMGDRKTATKWKIEDERNKGNYTLFTYDEVEFDVDIPQRKFSLRELER